MQTDPSTNMYGNEGTPLAGLRGPLSEPYRKAVRILLLNACAAFVAGVFSGLVTTEVRATIPFSKVPPGMNLEATLHLMLVHGHIITLLVLVPVAMAGMLVFARAAGGKEIASKFLPRFAALYLFGAWLSVALLFVRGFQVAYLAKGGETDFDAIAERVLFNAPVRFAVYLVAHVALTLGILAFVYHVAKSLRTSALTRYESVALS